MTTRPRQYSRSALTRERILDEAERLFALQGVSATSKRQVTEAAGQSNNAAVDYHFGSWENLVRAVPERHVADVEARRERLLAELPGDPDLRDCVRCMVQPYTDHLASLPQPSAYARINLQLSTDPRWRAPAGEDTPSMRSALALAARHAAAFGDDVRAERFAMGRLLVQHLCAERELALHEGRPTLRRTWEETGQGLIEAITALWTQN